MLGIPTSARGNYGHRRGVLCPSGVRSGLLRAVVNTPIRSGGPPLGGLRSGQAQVVVNCEL